MKRFGQFYLLAFLIVFGAIIAAAYPMLASADTASWTANSETDLAGYSLYMAAGSCASPANFVKVATYNKAVTSGPVPNPSADGTYCFVLTAFDTSNNESLFSNKVENVMNVVPPSAPKDFAITKP